MSLLDSACDRLAQAAARIDALTFARTDATLVQAVQSSFFVSHALRDADAHELALFSTAPTDRSAPTAASGPTALDVVRRASPKLRDKPPPPTPLRARPTESTADLDPERYLAAARKLLDI